MLHAHNHAARSGRRRWIGIAAGLALATGGLAAVPSPAFAGSGAVPTTLSGSQSLGSETISTTSGALTGSLTFSADLDWSQPAAVNIDWTDDKVRQGRDLDPTVAYTRPVPGSMSVEYGITGSLGIDTGDPFGVLGLSVGATMTASGPCALKGSGPDYACHLESSGIKVIDPTIGAPGLPYLELRMVADVTVTPEGLATLRTASTEELPLGTNDLSLGEDAVVDPLQVPCGIPEGSTLNYALGDFSTSPGLHVVSAVQMDVGAVLPNPITFVPGFYQSFFTDTFPVATTDTSITMGGAGGSVSMGAIQPNNIAPTLGAISAPDGVEGTPIQFSTSATGPCADGATYSWDFGDGSGPGHTATPQHEYADDGVYTGQVVVTDSTGLTDVKDFTVVVSNAAPNVNVLPDNPVTVPWGKPLTLKAQAVDPGAADQSTLTYDWTFADGDDIDDGGPSVTHQWATPGAYMPTVNVCDKDGACTERSFTVNVRKRVTTLSYTGPHAGTWSAGSLLTASLVDEFGNAVNGAPVDFTLDGGSAGSATTNAGGSAARNHVVMQSAGSYLVAGVYAGSALYEPDGSGDQAFEVSEMSSALTYTGGVKGSPNKYVALSAKLVDGLGRPLAGQTVTFVLGDQATSAVTNSSGVAATTLKLNQKPGWYPMTVSWDGVGGQLLADDLAMQFNLNKK